MKIIAARLVIMVIQFIQVITANGAVILAGGSISSFGDNLTYET
jgi:hypothetical protein